MIEFTHGTIQIGDQPPVECDDVVLVVEHVGNDGCSGFLAPASTTVEFALDPKTGQRIAKAMEREWAHDDLRRAISKHPPVEES